MKRVNILFLIAIVCLSSQADAQHPFQTEISVGVQSSVLSCVRSADGGYVVSGYWQTAMLQGSTFSFLMKFDSLGQLIWSKTSPISVQSTGDRIILSSDSGYYLTGSLANQTYSSILLTKLTKEAQTLWTRRHNIDGASYSSSLAETSDGGVIIAATSGPSPKTYQLNPVLSRFDEKGNHLWSRILYQDTGGNLCNSISSAHITKLRDGTFIVFGSPDPFSGCSVEMFWKIDEQGKSIWSHQLVPKSSGVQVAAELIEASNRDLIVTGYELGTFSTSFAFVERLDSTGVVKWYTRILDSTSGGYGLIERSDHDLLLVASDYYGISLHELTKDGGLRWSKQYTLPAVSLFSNQLVECHNGAVVVGEIRPFRSTDPRNGFMMVVDSSFHGCGNQDIQLETVSFGSNGFRYDNLSADTISSFTADVSDFSYTDVNNYIASLCQDQVETTTSSSKNISVFPNPVSHHSQINIQLADQLTPGTYNISLRDMLGKEVYGKQLLVTGAEQTLSFDLPYIASGAYVVELCSVSGEVVLRSKVIVE